MCQPLLVRDKLFFSAFFIVDLSYLSLTPDHTENHSQFDTFVSLCIFVSLSTFSLILRRATGQPRLSAIV